MATGSRSDISLCIFEWIGPSRLSCRNGSGMRQHQELPSLNPDANALQQIPEKGVLAAAFVLQAAEDLREAGLFCEGIAADQGVGLHVGRLLVRHPLAEVVCQR